MALRVLMLSASAVKALESDPDVLAQVEVVADAIAASAARRAPKLTGAGAESIHSEPDPDEPGFRVSWSKDQFYLAFHELGTTHQSARPFLRPAADEFNNRR